MELFRAVTYYGCCKRGPNSKYDMRSNQQIHKPLPKASVEHLGAVRSPDASEPERTTNMSAEHKVDIAIPAIEFRHVDFSYDDKKVLDDLTHQDEGKMRDLRASNAFSF